MTQNKTYRMHQVNRLLQEEIAYLLLTELQDETFVNITVNEVRTTKDLRHATVYITILNPKQREDILEALNHSSGHIRKLLGSKTKLKRTPELAFQYDESLDHAVRIMDKLKEIEHELHEDEKDAWS